MVSHLEGRPVLAAASSLSSGGVYPIVAVVLDDYQGHGNSGFRCCQTSLAHRVLNSFQRLALKNL